MTKADFLGTLQGALGGASPEERAAALQYYNEYFDEAGPEREEAVAEELGSPLDIAAEIMGTSPPAGGGKLAKAEAGRASGGEPFGVPPPPKAPPPPFQSPAAGGFGGQGAQDVPYTAVDTTPMVQPPPPGRDREMYSQNNLMVLKIIILVFACIFIVPLLGGLIAGLAGVAVAIMVCFAVPLIVGVALVFGGILSLVVGIIIMAPSAASGLVALGTGVTLVMLGLMSFYGGVKLYGKALPAIIRGVGQLVGKLVGLVKGLFNKPSAQNTGGYHG